MKAIVYIRHGSPDVLQLKEVDQPVPAKDQVLIKVHAAALNALDSHMMRGIPLVAGLSNMLGNSKPKTPGVDLSGTVEAIGNAVTRFKVGDSVFGCARNAIAEYAVTTENRLVSKPQSVSFEAASTVGVAGFTALQGLRDRGRIQSGQKVLIEGAGGGVGTFAVQIAKSFGAEVTAVCSTRNLEMARTIGADCVIDYTQEDFTRGSTKYDLIMRANGYHPISAYKRVLTPRGVLVLAGTSKPQIPKAILQIVLLGPLTSLTGNQKVRGFIARVNEIDLFVLRGLLESGQLKPVIDKEYPLSETAEAIRYLEEWHSGGKVIIKLPAVG